MNYRHLCMACMKNKGDYDVCMHCGWAESADVRTLGALPLRTVLYSRYLLGIVLFESKQSISYKAWDMLRNDEVIIVEYFPSASACREENSCSLKATAPSFGGSVKTMEKRAAELLRIGWNGAFVNVLGCFAENNTVYLVTEAIIGETLKEYMDASGGRIQLHDAAAFLSEIASGVQKLHDRGMLHLHIDPASILVKQDGASGRTQAKLFLTAAWCGGPTYVAYVSPEQKKRNVPLAPSTDVFALGRVLERIMQKQGAEADAAARLSPKEQAALNQIIQKATYPQPKRRIPSMTRFAEMLTAITHPKQQQQQRQQQRQRHRKKPYQKILGIAGAAITLALGAACLFCAFSLRDIRVWYPVDEAEAYRTKSDSFIGMLQQQMLQAKPFCTVKFQPVSEAEYSAKLEEARKNHTMPDVFLAPMDIAKKEWELASEAWEICAYPEEISGQLQQYHTQNPEQAYIPAGFRAKGQQTDGGDSASGDRAVWCITQQPNRIATHYACDLVAFALNIYAQMPETLTGYGIAASIQQTAPDMTITVAEDAVIPPVEETTQSEPTE